MTAYEMMLSESQERMLMVLTPEKTQLAKEVFEKWGVDFEIVGQITDTNNLVVKHNNKVEANIPITYLTDSAPIYKRDVSPRNKNKNLLQRLIRILILKMPY